MVHITDSWFTIKQIEDSTFAITESNGKGLLLNLLLRTMKIDIRPTR